jgi:cell division transport system ATP-binding protein
MIRFEQVAKRYPNGHVGLHELTFRVRPGEFLFVTGHSGAGKSTLLRLLLAMERPTSGKLLLAGQDLSTITNAQIPFLRRQIGVVFQNHQLLFDRTVYDNVALPLQILGLSKPEIAKRVGAALERVSLSDKAAPAPGDLSTGQQQRVGVARALAVKPNILLMDEPCSALDPTSTRVIEETMLELKDEVTIVIVTHNMQQAQRVSQQCAFFLASQGTPGQIIEHGPTDMKFAKPKDDRTNDYVRGRFG